MSAVGLRAAYGAREVLHGVDLDVRAGEVLAIVGPNGAGKTTLLRALSGVVPPTAGEVLLDERPLSALSRQEIARVIAVVPQDVPRAPGFTVREVVAMGRAPHQDAWLRERRGDVVAVDAALERCGLGALAARPFDDLSGGERKRVLVAQALSQSARVLLLDEPSAFLDLRHAVTVFELAREEASRSVAVAAIVHDLSLAARFADRVALLVDGAVLSVGPPAEVLEEAKLGAAFGVRIRRLSDQGTFAFAPDPASR
ncbi:MAG: ABC transporter ATP-binding protein [Deltaproteobacteria bacterium]|nr:ABC transporter ATP-binding protein [Deltaproteobacteria bacterium]